ncbi:T9SS type A sorting domain-containing protein [Winogradskyella sp. UBA3174]|mgnify:CR=1 FL=1|uniref:T9SS type A sorting domain-containing protein n=1 Tax=Winogradskyella sp. UBA3174 TaxID=1947785 RepID=UPI0025D62D7F|nr:T9SS type A sorting domain-containing protein [Winogradskyella sp. UBA3174]|tara:strand:- start:17073 stop:17804 length:732 start_codon:yes stop_codon:yes gene_type:complete
MKKTLLLLSLMLSYFVSFAQFELRKTSTDELITDGQTIAFNESGPTFGADYNWKFKVTNTSTSDIYMRIFVDNMTNTDGTNYQLCFAGVCLNSIATGSGYPSSAALILPGESNTAGNSLWNQHPTGTTDVMSWTFRYQAFDIAGNEIGTPLLMTYSYDINLSVEESELTNVQIFPTSVKNELTVTSNEVLDAEIFNILGAKVKHVKTNAGTSIINISDLSSQLYIIRFTNETGKQIIKKIVKE